MPKGSVFGCNAIYRDFETDFIVAIDPGIISEILLDTKAKKKLIVPPQNEQYEPEEYNPARPRENSGMVAMRESIKMGFSHLNCVGFDFIIKDNELKQDNIYKDTKHYGYQTKASLTDIDNRIRYMKWFAMKNNSII